MNSRDLLRITSRTFALGIERLPHILCDATTIAYLLLRVSDYLEDNEEMESGEKVTLFIRSTRSSEHAIKLSAGNATRAIRAARGKMFMT